MREYSDYWNIPGDLSANYMKTLDKLTTVYYNEKVNGR